MNWFWNLIEIDPSKFADLGSATEGLPQVLPLVFVTIVVLGSFLYIDRIGKTDEEDKEEQGQEVSTELDQEIARIRESQRK